ncbi:MAG: acylphosphatase [Caldilineaceae bacterium]
MQRLTAIVHGRVQGVYFRDYTRREAIKLQITGWVANQSNSTVKVVAEGAESALTQLLAWLHTGSPSAQVTSVDVEWSAATDEFSHFEIRW